MIKSLVDSSLAAPQSPKNGIYAFPIGIETLRPEDKRIPGVTLQIRERQTGEYDKAHIYRSDEDGVTTYKLTVGKRKESSVVVGFIQFEGPSGRNRYVHGLLRGNITGDQYTEVGRALEKVTKRHVEEVRAKGVLRQVSWGATISKYNSAAEITPARYVSQKDLPLLEKALAESARRNEESVDLTGLKDSHGKPLNEGDLGSILMHLPRTTIQQ